MQRTYIKDFSELAKILREDADFCHRSCSAWEDSGSLICVIRIMYSIYLYFQYKENWSTDDVRAYIEEMRKYLRVGKTSQYHYINTVRIAIEHNDTKPMYYAEIGALLVESEALTFLCGLLGIANADGTLERVFAWFEEEDKMWKK